MKLSKTILSLSIALLATAFTAHADSKHFTLTIHNLTAGVGDTKYEITNHGVTECVPSSGDSMPKLLKVACVDHIVDPNDRISIHFEKYNYMPGYIWNYDLGLRNVKDNANVTCYIVGKEGNVSIRCDDSVY